MKPFRWNIARREQLGSWLVGIERPSIRRSGLLADLRPVAARILAFANDADLTFVGRTPENFFDYLSGVFAGMDQAPELRLIQFSLRWAGEGGVQSMQHEKLAAMFDYLAEEGLAPEQIARSPRPAALVDFVAHGGTMRNLIDVFRLHAERDGVDWNAVQRRLKIIGLRVRTHNSPNTWRWQQHQDWLHLIPDTEIKNVSAPAHLLYHIANDQPKVTHAFVPGRWGLGEAGHRDHSVSPEQLLALATAVQFFDAGQTREERQHLAKEITALPELRQPATRQIVSLLKN